MTAGDARQQGASGPVASDSDASRHDALIAARASNPPRAADQGQRAVAPDRPAAGPPTPAPPPAPPPLPTPRRGGKGLHESLLKNPSRRGRAPSSFDDKRSLLAEVNPDLLLANGFEESLIGLAECGGEVIAVYDRAGCITRLMYHGMTTEEAETHFAEHVTGGATGPHAPAFFTPFAAMGPSARRKGTPAQCLSQTRRIFERIEAMPAAVRRLVKEAPGAMQDLTDPNERLTYALYAELLKAAELATDWLRADHADRERVS